MRSKTITTMFAVFAAVLFLASFASAQVSLSIEDINDVNHDDGSFDVVINLFHTDSQDVNTYTFDLTGSIDSGSATFEFDETETGIAVSPSDDSTNPIVIEATVDFDAFQTGSITGNVEATGDFDISPVSFGANILDSFDFSIDVQDSLTESQDGLLRIENTGNLEIEELVFTVRDTSDFTATVSPSELSDLAAGDTSQDVTVSTTVDLADLGYGSHTITLDVEASADSETLTKSESFTITNAFCSAGEQGTRLEITDIDINNRDGDDEELELLDTVVVTVDVENNDNDENVDEVIVVLGMFDSNGNDVADDLDFVEGDEEVDLGKIRDGDDDTARFEFRIPADFDEDNYEIVVKAYDDDNDFGEDLECTEEVGDDVSVERTDEEDRFVVVDEIIMDAQATCGDVVSGSFTVYNVGDEEQERVLINMDNSALGIAQEFEITSDFEEGDDTEFSYNFRIPPNAEDGIYNIEFRTHYDYNRGIYRERSDRTFVASIDVLGCGSSVVPIAGAPSGNVVITASLGSDVIPGEELVIESQITNLGDEFISVAVDAQGFDSWADLDGVSPGILTLTPGQTGSVEFTFTVDEDATGSESFVIQTRNVADNQVLQVQELEVFVEGEDSGEGFSFDFSDNGLIWVIGIINFVLIVLIVLVAVRLSRR